MHNPLIALGDVIGRTGYCARRVLLHGEHSPPTQTRPRRGDMALWNDGMSRLVESFPEVDEGAKEDFSLPPPSD